MICDIVLFGLVYALGVIHALTFLSLKRRREMRRREKERLDRLERAAEAMILHVENMHAMSFQNIKRPIA